MPPEFWAYKDTDGQTEFGFFLSSVMHAGKQYDGGYKGGGALHTFWTRDAGIVVLSRLPGFFNTSESEWSGIEQWPVAHVWGMDGATPFSIAETRDKVVTDNTGDATPNIHQEIAFSNANEDSWVELTATAKNDGLEIEHIINGASGDEATELWGSIPIHLRDGSQSASTETVIEYWDGSAWQNVTTTLVSTEALRLSRDFGSGPAYVYVRFESAESVKLSSSTFDNSAVSGTSQSSTLTRNVHVDLHGNPGTAIPVPEDRKLIYTLQTTEPLLQSGVQHVVELQEGWNMSALPVEPEDTQMELILADVINDIQLVKDVDGNIFSPELDIESLQYWEPNKAYWIYANNSTSFSVEGEPIDTSSFSISLEEGWSLVPYVGTASLPVSEAFQSLGEDLVIVKSLDGSIYLNGGDIDTIGSILPGQGYQVYVDNGGNITFP